MPGAFVRHMRSDMMLVVGLHGRSVSQSSALSKAAEDAEWLTDAIMAEMFTLALGKVDLPHLVAVDEEKEKILASQRIAISAREREIIDLLSRGFRNKQIAFELSITENTVETHLRRIYSKLGVNNRTSLMRRFMNSQGMFHN